MKKDQKKIEPLTLKAFLVGDLRLPIGDITLTDADDIEMFATAAYKKAQGSLKRLMQPKWAVVVVDQNGSEHSFGLDKWNKLYSPEERHQRALDAQERETKRKAKAAGLALH